MSLVTPQEADQAAERVLQEYAAATGAASPDDLRKVLELLISKSARAIEKYCGNQLAVQVLARTAYQVEAKPAPTTKH